MVELSRYPYWDETSLPRYPKLEADTTADVVVIGGGNTGLLTAYLLAEAGKSVVVLERKRCGSGDTGYTSAHLTMVTDSRLHKLAKTFGHSHAQAFWDAGFAAIAEIERVIVENEIDAGFDWIDGYLYLKQDGDRDEQLAGLERDAALARECGFDAEFVEVAPFVGVPAVRFGSQARFHPRKYLSGVLRALDHKGVRVFEHSEADEFCADPLSVTANGHRVSCKDIVLATHNPLLGNSSLLSGTLAQTKLALYSSYVMAGRVPKDTIPDALWWDTGNPYSYLRVEPHRDYDIAIFGGCDHKTGQDEGTERRYQALEDHFKPMLPHVQVTHRWSGQVIQTPDGLPYIGETAPHQYAATGFVGNGLTFGTLAAIMIADAIAGRRNPWADLFAPERKALTRGVWDYISENKDYPYYLLRDWLFGEEARSLRSIKRGQGAIVRRGGKPYAASRDDRGRVTVRSAICTHLGCIVKWNDAERTWDCPCHGSRFTPSGEVIAGPAESPLSPADAADLARSHG
jgi:glycine/D-amino acid oxidase-like deaminating enzyme/nitrite reductase/ring-hydroxylating ferredoxin subunit